jgi:hypothetical protein
MAGNWLSDWQIRNRKLGGCSRTSLNRYRLADPKFPRPRRYGGRNLTPEHEIDAYLEVALIEPLAPEPQPRDRRGRFADTAEASSAAAGRDRRSDPEGKARGSP